MALGAATRGRVEPVLQRVEWHADGLGEALAVDVSVAGGEVEDEVAEAVTVGVARTRGDRGAGVGAEEGEDLPRDRTGVHRRRGRRRRAAGRTQQRRQVREDPPG